MRARLLEWRELAPETRHFVFEALDVESLAFVPGQFVSFTAPITGKLITRAYSLAAPPQGRKLELCLNRVQEGRFSPYLFDLQPGAEVDMTGPYGTFVPRQPVSDSVLVATGTGIAPFRAILPDLLARDSRPQVTLIFGVRYERGLLYRAEFEEFARAHANFRFRPTLSRPEPSWQGRTGHVQPHLLETIGRRRDMDVYICGLKEMVDDMRAQLKAAGLERRRIIYEKYN
ncbi:MAG: FAD-dependent oxidoreductase [Acidobacteria bacterium]|nr:FAD-dependent oxidoreductase [Acidobacteriota bacterium]